MSDIDFSKQIDRVYVARRPFEAEPKSTRDNILLNRSVICHSSLLIKTTDGKHYIVQYGGGKDRDNITVESLKDYKSISKNTEESYEIFQAGRYKWTKQLIGKQPQKEWTLGQLKETMAKFDGTESPPKYGGWNFVKSKVCHQAQLYARKQMGIADENETYSHISAIGKSAVNVGIKTAKSLAKLTEKVLTKAVSIKEAAKELVGGIELSLQDTGIDLDKLYGFNFDPTNKALIALCQKNDNQFNINDDDIKMMDNDDEITDDNLKDDDSIIKKLDGRNSKSIMVWQHFCAFLKMFHEDGDREDVSFSLDPAKKLEQGESNKDIPMKKVYYPENLRWSKAGEVMFDADLFIKTLLYDLHDDVTKYIPNYKSHVQQTLDAINFDETEDDNKNNQNWHRLWIVLDEIDATQDNNSFIINKIKFKINVRHMKIHEDGKLHDDLNENEDELLMQFVNHMNDNMDIIHKHSLFLQRLEGVFRALFLAKFIYKHNIPFNMDLINQVNNEQKQELQEYGIEFEIPSIVKTVKKSREIIKDDHIIQQTKTHTFSGGINLKLKSNQDKIIATSLSESGEKFIKNFEGFRDTAYKLNGKAHIGFGDTNNVKLADVLNGKKITTQQGEKDFKENINKIEQCFKRNIKKDINLTQNQHDALVSLVFNIGTTAFKNSTLLKKLNDGDFEEAAEQFAVWNKVTIENEKVVCKGLVNRRKAEMELFLKETEAVKKVKTSQAQLKSINRVFNEINESVKSMQSELNATRITFERLCDVKNKDKEYTAILFPDILIDRECGEFCEADDCKQDISWSKSNIYKDKKYCKKHYDEQRYVQCTRCNEIIDKLDDEFREIGNKENGLYTFHEECCSCYFCDKLLESNVRIHSNGDSIGLFCDGKCFKKSKGFTEENAIKKCIKCGKDVDVLNEENIVQVGNDNILHISCLKCDECGDDLQGKQTIWDGDNHIFCREKCANKQAMKQSLAESGHDNINDVNMCCYKCNGDILSGYIQIGQDKFIHPECLKCDECNKVIEGGSTIIDGDDNMFCSNKCADKRAGNGMENNNNNDEENKDNDMSMCCAKCKDDIVSGYIKLGDGKFIHPECLRCNECDKQIEGGKTVMDNKNNIFCSKDCAQKKAMKEIIGSNDNNGNKDISSIFCHKCKNELLLTKDSIVTMGKDVMLHKSCCICYYCGIYLNGGVVMDGNKNMFCCSECGNKFHSQ